jgi:hypothetical protein
MLQTGIKYTRDLPALKFRATRGQNANPVHGTHGCGLQPPARWAKLRPQINKKESATAAGLGTVRETLSVQCLCLWYTTPRMVSSRYHSAYLCMESARMAAITAVSAGVLYWAKPRLFLPFYTSN